MSSFHLTFPLDRSGETGRGLGAQSHIPPPPPTPPLPPPPSTWARPWHSDIHEGWIEREGTATTAPRAPKIDATGVKMKLQDPPELIPEATSVENSETINITTIYDTLAT